MAIAVAGPPARTSAELPATLPKSSPLTTTSVDQACRLEVLWIDDEADDALCRLLRDQDCHVRWASTGDEGLRRAGVGRFDVIVVDVRLDDMSGLTVLRRLSAGQIASPVLIVTGHYLEDETLDDALRFGASAVAYKPFLDPPALAAALRVVAGRGGRSPLLLKRSQPSSAAGSIAGTLHAAPGIVATSRLMRDVLDWADQAAGCDATVLLTGETGVGKEVVARAIHSRSRRCRHPFVAVNCGAVPETLFESELFGHCQGAFTGAVRDRPGLIHSAQGGTLLLDEIGDIPPAVQGRLLRFLDSGEVRRVGDTKTARADVRVIAATNRNLVEEVERRQFREDLYFRLSVLQRHIPPLRERHDDIAALVTSWFPELARRHRRSLRIGSDALAALCAYEWPGNVRELRNVLERAICEAGGAQVTADEITRALPPRDRERENRGASEIQRTLSLLDAHDGNHTRAARALGINRTTLWRRLRRQHIDYTRQPR